MLLSGIAGAGDNDAFVNIALKIYQESLDDRIWSIIMIQKVMEKRKPHYVLSVLKELFRKGEKTRAITNTALKGAASEGYMTVDDIGEISERLGSEHFYKSMTAYHDHKIWQDVYKFQDGDKGLYIKLQLPDDGRKAILIQMKRDEGRDE